MMMKLRRHAGSLFAVAGFLFLIDFAIRNEIVLYHPDNVLISPLQAGVPEAAPITLRTSDGLSLRSWFLKPKDDAKPVFLFFMGDTGSLADRAGEFRPYIDHGYGILLLGYRGFNGNSGKPYEKGLYRDARAAIAWLNGNGYDDSKIVLYGHSLGTGIAVQMGTEIEARAVILEAPYTTLPDTVGLNVPWLRANWFMKDRYDNLAKMQKIRSPLMIIQGDADEVIPEAQGRALYKAAKAPKLARFIPEAGHNNLYEYGEADLVMEFLDHPPHDDGN